VFTASKAMKMSSAASSAACGLSKAAKRLSASCLMRTPWFASTAGVAARAISSIMAR
jgi:hypothetical protein